LLRPITPVFTALQVGETYADVKLSDLGAARNVKTSEEYTYIATKEHLPARWLPLEASLNDWWHNRTRAGGCVC